MISHERNFLNKQTLLISFLLGADIVSGYKDLQPMLDQLDAALPEDGISITSQNRTLEESTRKGKAKEQNPRHAGKPFLQAQASCSQSCDCKLGYRFIND